MIIGAHPSSSNYEVWQPPRTWPKTKSKDVKSTCLPKLCKLFDLEMHHVFPLCKVLGYLGALMLKVMSWRDWWSAGIIHHRNSTYHDVGYQLGHMSHMMSYNMMSYVYLVSPVALR